MTSTLGWLDTDETHRKRSLEIIDLFKDQGTVDEIGIGTIRDTIADVLFPYTSVLQTRTKYALFIPWIIRDVASMGLPVEAAGTELRKREVALIESLLLGYEGNSAGQGIIGSQARSRVKRLPSAAYWRALGGWDLVTWGTSIDGHFRRARALRATNHQTATTEDPGSGQAPDLAGVDRGLPPADPQFLKSTTFDLTLAERDYLVERIGRSTEGSLLSWMCFNPSDTSVDDVPRAWLHHDMPHMPADQCVWLDHGRRFSISVHGAALLYNLLLSEKQQNQDRIDSYRKELSLWRAELASEAVFDGWDRGEFWRLLSGRNRIHPRTQTFVSAWIDQIESDDDVAGSPAARELVARREQSIKGGRSRLSNPAALDAWQGRSGLVRLDFRWGVAQQMLLDFEAAVD